MVEGGIKKGLQAICITDHYDKDYPKETGEIDDTQIFDPKQYFDEIRQLQEEYKERIELRIGVELGLLPHLGPYYKDLVMKYPFDFVIGSPHIVFGEDPYTRKIFTHRTDEEVYSEAFKEILLNIERCQDFDVLGHMDYVVRYGKERDKHYSYERFSTEIDEILKKIIHLGKGIEINTSGLKYGLPFCHPHFDIIKRYRDLGGEIITVASDAHIPEHIAYDFHKVPEILTKAGFKYYTEFKDRKPSFYPIN